MKLLAAIISVHFVTFAVGQGPYDPAAGEPGTLAMHKDSSAFIAWADACDVVRGWMDVADTSLGKVSAGTDVDATGKPGTNGIVSLGDGGIATLTFAEPIINGDGPDFAVFENSFSNDFLELAFVEVSSNGIDFFRFPATSLTDTSVQVDGFGSIDPTNINNLAGKYRVQFGTPFDLEELVGIPSLDVNAITHVRIIDVIGSVNDSLTTRDDQGRKVNDPYPTPFESGGFDLDAVGVMHNLLGMAESDKILCIYPNPVSDVLNIDVPGLVFFEVFDLNGQRILTNNYSRQLNVNGWAEGIYFLSVYTSTGILQRKFIVR